MAAPPEVTIKDLTGKWVMNDDLSDDADAVLAMQGIGWMMRKAISWATVTLRVKEYVTAEDGLTHIDTDQTATGGIKGTSELRTLDWQERDHEDHIFGSLKGRSRWIGTEDADWASLPEFMKEGWLEGEAEVGGPKGETHVHSHVANAEKGWVADQIWGFAVLDGERYYLRRVSVSKGAETLNIRLAYSWQGKE